MSCNIFCAQCGRKDPKQTSVSNFYCVGCNERLCPECSKNHTAIKGFSNHDLILSDTFSTYNFAYSNQCKLHPNSIPTWYCFRYNIYLCDECEQKARHDRVSCNDHVCFHTDPSYFALAKLETHVENDLEKMKKTLDICYLSRVANEDVLNTQISEKSFENDDDKRKVLDECLKQLKSEKKGIEKLQQYRQACQEEFISHFRSNNSRMLSFLMRMSNLKQTIITLYSSLNKMSLQPKDGIANGRLEKNLSPICEVRHLIIKSFQIEWVISLPETYVKKVILIDKDIVVFTDREIQRYNCRNQLENKIMVSYFDCAYIKKYRLVAVLVCDLGYSIIKFFNIDSFIFENKLLRLGYSHAPQSISIIDATSEFVYFAGRNCVGRVNLDDYVERVAVNGEVGSSMHISNEEIFILCGNCVNVYSLKFDFLRKSPPAEVTLALRTEFKAEYQPCGFQKENPYNNNAQTTCNFFSLTCVTTDHDNNVYAATDSQGIIRMNCQNHQWERVLAGCHGVRNSSFLCFDNEFANVCVCSKEFNCDKTLLFKYKVILDIVDI